MIDGLLTRAPKRRAKRNSVRTKPLKTKVRMKFYSHLSIQVGNGVSLVISVEDFIRRLEKRGDKISLRILRDVARRLKDGDSFSNAMFQHAPADEILMISSGDMSGDLPKALDLAVAANQRTARLRQVILGQMTTPLIYLILLWAILYVIGATVVPQMAVMLPPSKWTGTAYLLYLMGEITHGWAAYLVPLFVVGTTFAVIVSLPRWRGKWRLFAERNGVKFFPLIGMIYPVYRDLQGYSWLISFSALLSAGMDNVSALKDQLKYATPWLAERLELTKKRMEDGWDLGEALSGVRRDVIPTRSNKKKVLSLDFPNPEMIEDIVSFAGFPDFHTKIVVIADKWATETEENLTRAIKVINFAAQMLMFAAFIVMQLGSNQVSSQLSSAIGH